MSQIHSITAVVTFASPPLALDNLHCQIADLKAQAVTAHRCGFNECAVRLNARAVTLEIAATRIEMRHEGCDADEIRQYVKRNYGVTLR